MPPKSLADADAADGLLRLNFGYPDQDAYAEIVDVLTEERVARRLSVADRTLWSDEPVAEADLSWISAPSATDLASDIESLRSRVVAEGLDVVVLIADDGTAPGARLAAGQTALTVIDGFDPEQIEAALDGDLGRTLLVAQSSADSDLVTAVLGAFESTMTEAGIDFPSRVVAVAPSQSELGRRARNDTFRAAFDADGSLAGAFGALGPYGLVAAGLAGADIRRLLSDAASVEPDLQTDSADNPALRLGALLGMAHWRHTDKVVVADNASGVPELSGWVAQLIAESTGKSDVGLLPVAVRGVRSPGFADAGADATVAFLGEPDDSPQPTSGLGVSVAGPAGAQVLVWQYALAVTARMIGVGPFEQQLVALESAGEPQELVSDGAAVVYGDPHHFRGVRTAAEALDVLIRQVPDYGYLGVLAYLGGGDGADRVRDAVADATGIQTAVGRGSGMLDALGSYFALGRDNGAVLILTAAADVDVPTGNGTFGHAEVALARGAHGVLNDRRRPALRLHLADRHGAIDDLITTIHQQLSREVR
ncbi:glucose-6-phosphate isomerase [Spelaeicoccus albus]|uniref:Glucose-6-phosphate isomerase n=1 Tax=Spelaeicoccus albus TaxID=1280376 RepID=A0A7Z0D462_9MICO|nr:glucose-6-phosphate isomerase [Spelaeicoccus albus]NYI68529.1 glucose-6-phosphate isomerase [Spelaeicoccus albus]